MKNGKALSGKNAGTDFIYQIKFFNQKDNMLVSCQKFGIRIWTVDYWLKIIIYVDENFGNLKRQIQCMCIDSLDKYGYFGNKSGGILQNELASAIYKKFGPYKKLFPQGVTTIKMLPNSDLLLGTQEGVLAKIGFIDFKFKNETKLLGGITSISLTADCSFFFCGTEISNIFWCESASLKNKIRNTCHNARINDFQFPYEYSVSINDIQFPYEYSGVFGKCSKNVIRI